MQLINLFYFQANINLCKHLYLIRSYLNIIQFMLWFFSFAIKMHWIDDNFIWLTLLIVSHSLYFVNIFQFHAYIHGNGRRLAISISFVPYSEAYLIANYFYHFFGSCVASFFMLCNNMTWYNMIWYDISICVMIFFVELCYDVLWYMS